VPALALVPRVVIPEVVATARYTTPWVVPHVPFAARPPRRPYEPSAGAKATGALVDVYG